MCFSAELSKRSLSVGIFSGVALILFSDDKHRAINNFLGVFFIFISIVQYIEYLIWTDLQCTNGNNEVAGTMGPLMIYLQPVVLCALAMCFLKNNKNELLRNIILSINVCYFIYVIYKYQKFMKQDNICTKIVDGHLKWSWNDITSNLFYSIVLFANILYFLNDTIGYVAFGLTYFYLFISTIGFSNHIGESWCYLSTSTPLVILLLEKFIL